MFAFWVVSPLTWHPELCPRRWLNVRIQEHTDPKKCLSVYAILVLLARHAKHVHVPGCLTIAQPQDRARSGPMFLFSAHLSSFWFFWQQPQNMQEWYWIWSFGFVVVSCRIWFFDGLTSVLSLFEESCTPLSTAKGLRTLWKQEHAWNDLECLWLHKITIEVKSTKGLWYVP